MTTDMPVGTPAPVKRSSRFLWPAGLLVALLILAGVGTYAWYYRYNACEVKAVEEASTILVSQMGRYGDVYQVAIAATPSSVVLPLSVLRQVMVDTQQVPVPACLQKAKNELVQYMQTINQAFSAYGEEEPDSTVRALVDEALTHLDHFDAELAAVKKCAPFCAPWD